MTAAEHIRVLGLFAPHTLVCGFMRRFFRNTMLLRRIVSQEIFGPLLQIDIGEGDRSKGSGVDASFLDDPRLGASRGVLADLGSHSIDLAIHLSGATAFDVQTCSRILDGSVDRKVSAAVKLNRESAQRPSVDLNYGVSWLDRQTNQIRLRFPHTCLWSELAVTGDVYIGDPATPRERITLTSAMPGATTYNQAFYLEWRDFLDNLRVRRESLISARSALLTTSLVESLLARDRGDHD
jgi:predicted dehydrogenase